MKARVPFANRRPIDPRRSNIALDANALNRHGTEHDALVDRFERLLGGAGAPAWKKEAMLPRIFNLRPGLTSEQHVQRDRVARILQGNAQPNKHAADASHLSEASETGCSYFITHDQHILKKRNELHAVLPPNLWIVTLEEFLRMFDDFRAGLRL
jgi:hypothetical protein